MKQTNRASTPSEDFDDATLNAVASLNPIDPAGLPNSRSGDGAALLSAITDNAQAFPAYRAPTPQPQRSQRVGLLAAAAAVLALLVGAALVLSPTSTTPALAEVRDAASGTAEISSGRAITTFSVDGTDLGETGWAKGRASASFNGDDLAVEIDIESASTGEAPVDGAIETRIVDGMLYHRFDGQDWSSVAMPGAIPESILDLVDARTVLNMIGEITEVSNTGDEMIDGSAMSTFEGVIDLDGASPPGAPWLLHDDATAESPGITAGIVNVKLWVHGNLVRRVEVEGNATEQDGAEVSEANFTIATDFVELGEPISITPPPVAETGPADA